MEPKVTQDHDEIRAWIEERGGRPALRERQGDQRGVIDIAFHDTTGEIQIISWEEFFDTFDSLNMEFRYECFDDTCKQYSYGFINKDEQVDEVVNETEMPEDDVPIENVIPSAPARESPDAFNAAMNYDI